MRASRAALEVASALSLLSEERARAKEQETSVRIAVATPSDELVAQAN